MNKINELIKRRSFFLLYLIGVEGFVSVAIEILVIRQLIPFVGTSVVVTSIIIGIFLLFMAMGYWRGGLYKTNFHEILNRNFIYAMLFLGIGLAYPFVELYFNLDFLLHEKLIILVGYLLIVIAPLIYFLGQTIPLTMNLVKQENLTGATGGKVLFLSTIGSFFGAILTTILLIEFLGVAWSIVINFLMLLSLVWLSPRRKQHFLYLLLSPVLLVLVFILNVIFERQYFVTTNNYANYEVRQDVLEHGARGNMLLLNGSHSSFIDRSQRGFPYIELIKKILFQDLALRNKNILVLGAGGFTLSAENDYGNHFTYLDIDRKIYPLVKSHFLAKIKGNFIAADARTYLRSNSQPYDVIVSDVYTNVNTIPAELMTLEHLQNLRNNLVPQGIAIFNIIARPFLNDPYSKRTDNTIRAVFHNCIAIPLNYQAGFSNIIYVCKKSLNENDSVIYTDDKNSITLDFFRIR